MIAIFIGTDPSMEMGNLARDLLLRQHDTAWKLMTLHLAVLSTEECLWRPARSDLCVRRGSDGAWRGEWPDDEGYQLGPPSIGWLTWHVGFWWSMTLNHAFGDASLARDMVVWSGSADGARSWIIALHDQWAAALDGLEDGDLLAPRHSQLPDRQRRFGDIIAWLNLELMKNAAEIGYARFLYASGFSATGSETKMTLPKS